MGRFLGTRFVAAWKKVGTFSITTVGHDTNRGPHPVKAGGNVATYFCTPDLRVIHAVAGNVEAEAFLDEAGWAADLAKEIEGKIADEAAALFKTAHEERVREIAEVLEDACSPSPRFLRGGVGKKIVVVHRILQVAPFPMSVGEVAKTIRGFRWIVPPNGEPHLLQLNPHDREVRTKLSESGLPALEAVQSHVFETLLRERLSDDPVRVVDAMDPNGTLRRLLGRGRVNAPDAGK